VASDPACSWGSRAYIPHRLAPRRYVDADEVRRIFAPAEPHGVIYASPEFIDRFRDYIARNADAERSVPPGIAGCRPITGAIGSIGGRRRASGVVVPSLQSWGHGDTLTFSNADYIRRDRTERPFRSFIDDVVNRSRSVPEPT
jgi:hypothetical protein